MQHTSLPFAPPRVVKACEYATDVPITHTISFHQAHPYNVILPYWFLENTVMTTFINRLDINGFRALDDLRIAWVFGKK